MSFSKPRRAVLLASLFVLSGCVSAAGIGQRHGVRVASDGRHLVRPDEMPFFWLADTAWELFHRTTRDEAEIYLENRRRKGFTVVQAAILAEVGGLRVPNANGDLPLIDNDPTRPNEAYFRYVDAIVGMANRKGLIMALLPTWGDKFNRKWGEGPEIFTPENARTYGEILGRRYRDRDVVWVLGGDRNPETERHVAIIRALGDGIRSAGARQPMTYHPQGGSKSWQLFADETWLDFHLFQSGHDHRDFPNHAMTLEGYGRSPAKPVIDGEPRYEDHPVALYRLGDDWRDGPTAWFDDFDVRQAAWWSMLSGAAGHTYGNHNIWQMWQPDRAAVSKARTPWRVALNHPGATQMGIMRRFLQRHGFGQLEPAQHLLATNGQGPAEQRAARSRDGRHLLVYTPLGEPVSLRPAGLGRMRATWFDPRTGTQHSIASVSTSANHMFDPPGKPKRGGDWVLALDSQ